MRLTLGILVLAPAIALAQGRSTQQTQARSTITVSSDKDIEKALERPKPWEGLTDTSSIPFVISASGGISLGSYQAGVTWALGRLTRYIADSAEARARLKLGKPELWAATGASAGNINAVLSAIEWCAAQPVLPEKSLFWRVWVNVGWPELFPETGMKSGLADFGVFDRRYFKEVLFKDIAKRMDTTAVRPSCDNFAIGVTATRIDPSYFQVTDQLTALTQRFAATFQLDTGVNGKKLVFRQADPNLRDRGMGEMLALAAGQSWVLSPDTLFSLIEASSSFPIAFSPRRLSYYPADSLHIEGTCPLKETGVGCKPPHQAYFTDGGVFDNNPLQLAFNLYERRAPQIDVKTPDGRVVASFPTVPPRALYVGTDDYRGPLQGAANKTIDRGPVGGIDAIARLVMGAIPSARQYEMQTLARSIADDRRVPRDYIRVTRRYFPVFGEHLGAFGAFLGRPFREWDFYAGLYDGIVFAARDVICMPRKGFDLDTTSVARERCAKDYTAQLISGTVVPLDPIAPAILGDMWAEEFKDTTRRAPASFRPAGASLTDTDRMRGLRALTQVQIRQLGRGTPICKDPDWAERFLCIKNLDKVLASVKEDTVSWNTYQRWSKQSPCTQGDTPTLESPCLADPTFVALVDDAEKEMKNRVGKILHRMWEVESAFERIADSVNRIEKNTSDSSSVPRFAPPHDGIIEFTEMILRSVDWPARHGIDLDPGSIPPEARGKLKRLTSILPYQFSLGMSGTKSGMTYSGFDMGWQPTYHLSDRIMVNAPISVSRWIGLTEDGDPNRATWLRAGAGVAYKLGGFELMSIGAAVRPTVGAVWWNRDGPGFRSPREPWRMVGYEVSAHILAGKGKVTLYHLGYGLVSRDASTRPWGLTIGVTDLPGIAYWLIR